MISICFEAPTTRELNALLAAHLAESVGSAPVATTAAEQDQTAKPKAKKAKAIDAPSVAVEAAAEPVAATAAAPVAPAPTAPATLETASASLVGLASVTLDDVKSSLMNLAGVAGMPKVAEILGQFNARKISELVESNFNAVKSTADALTAELKKT